MQQSGFAGTGRAHEGDEFSGRDLYGHILERHNVELVA
jgi:hypothetical protein